jgi:hypothetical protein
MKTILCDIVEDWATLLVYRDSLVKCSHFMRYGPMRLKSSSHGAIRACEGPEKCDFCHSYKEDVFCREAELVRAEQK